MALYDDNLVEIVKKLPTSPGVYQYFDTTGKIIYIGKAKNLKNRVSSYLNKTNQSSKTLLLVKQIADLKYIVVKTEQDALLLENNLIKKYKPKYNILLKDDKTYPWICVKKEPFPRVFITRRFSRNGSEYYGPYTSVKFAGTLMGLIKSMFRLRTCNLNLSKDLLNSGKYKVCLEYHIKNCDAPCVFGISEAEYDDNITQIKNILKGDFKMVIHTIKQKMNYYASNLQFEKAQQLKESLEVLEMHQTKSMIVRSCLNNIDVFSYQEHEQYAYVNYLRIVQGSVNQVHTIEIEKKIDEDKSAILSYAILEIRGLVNSVSREIVVPFMPDIQMDGLEYIIPVRGDKKQLLELSQRNALQFQMDRLRQRSENKREESKFTRLLTIKNELKLPTLPHRMECFDNSNIQGTNPVASCVVFIDGKPAKSEYRKFHVKTVVGADDFASMEEIIYRRYSRVLGEGLELPDLIVVDGGKGQLHAAMNSLIKLDLMGKVTIIGLAKRMEEIYYPGDSEPYIIAKNSLALKTLMHIRDEAHRFGITFHRQLREKHLIHSELNDIEGIGQKTVDSLLSAFKSVELIKTLSVSDLAKVCGNTRATLIHNYFNKN